MNFSDEGNQEHDRRHAHEQSASSHLCRRTRFRRRGYVVLTVVSAAFAAGRVFLGDSKPPNHLLARAFSERRTLEFRFPGARYAPFTSETRRSQRNGGERPISLLEAEAQISRVLSRRAEDPAWLQAQGRADLLEWNFESAIKTFRRAREFLPDSPSLLIDLATAYFERAQAEGRPIDYGQAIELLGRAIDTNPDDQIALFDRAIACERVHFNGQAVVDWEHYLRVDPYGSWAREAQQRLGALQKRLGKRRDLNVEPESSPAEFLRRHAASSNDLCCNYRPELYLQSALTDWLPAAFPADRSLPSGASQKDARRAIELLAAALLKKHGDRWMTDLIADSSSSAFARAAFLLSTAIRANAEGDPARALESARDAASLLRSAHCVAGAVRAELESAYALQRSAQGVGCAELSAKLVKTLKPRPWIWCKAQAELELASCLQMIGDLGQAIRAADRAIAATEAANYAVLRLRSVGFRAAFDTDAGNFAAAWARNEVGLDEFWADAYPSMRAYQFYDDMSVFAEEFAQWRLALVLAREAVAAMAATANRSSEAIARQQMARMALMAGARQEANREFLRAEQLFAALPQNTVVQMYRMSGEIGMARLELMHGGEASSSARLHTIRNKLAGFANYYMAMDFHQVQAQIDRRKGNAEHQEKSLRTVVAIAEHGIGSLENARERLSWLRHAEQSYRELVRIAWERKDFRSALELWEWYRGAELRSSPLGKNGKNANAGINFSTLNDGPPLPALSAVSDACPRLTRQTVISYAELSGGFAVWVYDNRGISPYWIATPDETLKRTARRLANRVADPASDLIGIRTDGQYLYRQLIAPIAGKLTPERTLVFELDGDLARVPLQVLIAPDGEYFGLKNDISFSPGLPYLLGLRESSHFHASNALVVGSPTISTYLAESFEPLPDATAEAQSVAARFTNAILLTGRQATLNAVVRELPRASLFHFAGHSIPRAGDAGLLLAAEETDLAGSSEAAILRPTSLNARTLSKCSLVVLSACSTERLSDDVLADPRSVPAALLAAGVPHVVTSAWNVDSRATAAFMKAFYDTLLANGSVTGSLRSAELASRRQPAMSHPYYWAAFKAWGQL